MRPITKTGETKNLRFFHPHALNILCQLSIYIHSPAVPEPHPLPPQPPYNPSAFSKFLFPIPPPALFIISTQLPYSPRRPHSLLRSFLPFFVVSRSDRNPRKKEERREERREDRPGPRAGQGREEAGSKRRWPAAGDRGSGRKK